MALLHASDERLGGRRAFLRIRRDFDEYQRFGVATAVITEIDHGASAEHFNGVSMGTMNIRVWRVAGLIAAVLTDEVAGQIRSAAPEQGLQISGRVVDASNLPLPRTTVTIIILGSHNPSKTVLSDQNGQFILPLESPLPYELRLEQKGFRHVTMRMSDGAIGNTTDLDDVVLQIGDVVEGPMVPMKAPRSCCFYGRRQI